MGVNQLRTPNIAMIAAACEFDGVYIDLEHNPTPLETASAICVARSASASHRSLASAPATRTTRPATSIAAPRASWFRMSSPSPRPKPSSTPAAIHRSAAGSGPEFGYAARPQREINVLLNEQTLLIAMLETPEAIANADAIAAVDGIDIVHIGSTDLSTEMGIPGEYTHARMREAYEATARAARAHSKGWGSAASARISNSRAG
jgi:2-keto-3-deoxy-L-rhamnonate aldolase RhmA